MKLIIKTLSILILLSPWASAQFDDRILSVSGPKQVSPGKLALVKVSYEASKTRKIAVLFHEISPPLTYYSQASSIISAGYGTVELSVSINNATPFKKNGYKFVAYITEEEGWWNKKLCDLVLTNVDCLAKSDTSLIKSITNLSNSHLMAKREIERKNEAEKEPSPTQNNAVSNYAPKYRDNNTNQNLIKNGDFSNGIANWGLREYTGSRGKISITPNQELFCEIIEYSGTSWHLIAEQRGLILKNGQRYRLTLRARAEKESRTLRVLLKMPGNVDAFLKDLTVTSKMNTYTVNFTVRDETEEHCTLEIHYGEENKIGIILDDISLKEVESKIDLGSTCPKEGSRNRSPATTSQV